MKKRIVWLLVGCVIVLSVIAASCGKAPMELTSVAPTTTLRESKTPVPLTTPASGAVDAKSPKYGGTIISVTTSNPSGFDPGVINSVMCGAIYFTHDKLCRGDWSKGPAGTGQTDWLDYLTCEWDLLGPSLAEKWETPDDTTIIYHVRKGAHWWNKAPVNGREITAEDVVFSINRQWNAPAAFHTSSWGASSRPTSVKALDKYTVEVKVPINLLGMHLSQTGGFLYMEPPEVVQQYGNYQDWKVMVASGPFVLTDYVSSSSLTFQKNPNYWAHDPVHPNNQLPYVDGLKRLIIPDASTRLAAMRTGKADYLQALSYDDFKELRQQVPQLETIRLYGNSSFLVARVDKPPFNDLRVRQAMNLALNKQEILDQYYSGQGDLLSWPWYNWKANAGAYIPLKDLPNEPITPGSRCSAQEVWGYNPDKAKQLLAEAGYPNGFKTNIVCTATQVDLLSICKDQLGKIGINMDLRVMETGVFNSFLRGRQHDQMIVTAGKFYFLPWFFYEVRIENFDNCAFYEDPKTRAAYNECAKYVMKDVNKTWQILKDVTPFMIEQCVMGGYLPIPYAYDMWWPWLQNWFGATRVGYWEPESNSMYAWVDVNLKKAMGH